MPLTNIVKCVTLSAIVVLSFSIVSCVDRGTSELKEKVKVLEQQLAEVRQAQSAMQHRRSDTATSITAIRLSRSAISNQPLQKTVIANEIVVEDNEGRTRARLFADDQGPLLGLYDANNKLGISLRMSGNQPRLDFWDSNSKIRAGLGMDSKNCPAMSLYDANGKPRVGLGVVDNQPSMQLWDSSSKPRVGLMIDSNRPIIGLFDDNGKYCMGMVIENKQPSLDLWDPNGVRRAGLWLNEENESRFVLFDKTIICALLWG